MRSLCAMFMSCRYLTAMQMSFISSAASARRSTNTLRIAPFLQNAFIFLPTYPSLWTPASLECAETVPRLPCWNRKFGGKQSYTIGGGIREDIPPRIFQNNQALSKDSKWRATSSPSNLIVPRLREVLSCFKSIFTQSKANPFALLKQHLITRFELLT